VPSVVGAVVVSDVAFASVVGAAAGAQLARINGSTSTAKITKCGFAKTLRNFMVSPPNSMMSS